MPSKSPPTVSLFVPCIAEHVYPDVAWASVRLLERAGARVTVPEGQTCCGQPPYKNGHFDEAVHMAKGFIERLEHCETLVGPTASCVAMVRESYPKLLADEPQWAERAKALAGKIFELSEYLVDHLGVQDLGAELPGRAAYHESCQMTRGLGLREQPKILLRHVHGLELQPLPRADRCCGMGGAFSVRLPEISAGLLDDKLEDLLSTEPDYIITAELSCLLNLDSAIRKRGLPVKALHLAQVLDSKGGRA